MLASLPAWAQTPSPSPASPPPPRPSGRVSFYMTADDRRPDGSAASTGYEFATSFTFRTPDIDAAGLEACIDRKSVV